MNRFLVRFKEGQRVLFHILNASATENIQLAPAGHQFQATALDGNPVPQPQLVDMLQLGTAERNSAIVKMKHPGLWLLGCRRTTTGRNVAIAPSAFEHVLPSINGVESPVEK